MPGSLRGNRARPSRHRPGRKAVREYFTNPFTERWNQINTVFAVIGYLLALLAFKRLLPDLSMTFQVPLGIAVAFLIGKAYKILLVPAITLSVIAVAIHYFGD